MSTLLSILDKYIASGVPSNAAWDMIKAAWVELSKRSWEDIYLDAFESAIKELEPQLKRYSDGYVSLSRKDITRILHQKLSAPVDLMAASELSDDDFVARLAEVIAEEESLLIGGHRLSDQDYRSLVQRVVDLATRIFTTEIHKQPTTFQRMISREAVRLQVSVREIHAFLDARFAIVAEQLNEISATVRSAREDTAVIAQGVENLQSVPEQFTRIFTELDTIKNLVQPSTQAGADEQVQNATVDFAVGLLQEGRPRSALKRLLQLADELEGKEPTSNVRFRLFTNIGACYLRLGDYEQAREHFSLAHSQNPNDVRAVTNLGIGELHCGGYVKALEYAQGALAKDSSHANALSLLLEAKYSLGDLDAVDLETRREAEKHVGSRRTLAVIFTKQGDLEAAEELLFANLHSDEAEAQDAMLLAQVVIKRIREEAQKSPPLPWAQTTGHVEISEVERLLQSPLESWKRGESRLLYQNALVLRSIIRALMGRYREALQDCQLVLGENPVHEDALRNGGLAALQNGDFKTAVHLLSQIELPTADSDTVVLALSTAYIHMGVYKPAVELLSDSSIDVGEQTRIHRLQLLAQGLNGLRDIESAGRVADELLAINPGSPVVLEAFASIMALLGGADRAETYYKLALEASNGGEQAFYALRLADFYFHRNQPDKAVARYEEAGVPEVDCRETRKYLIALLNSGYWNKAYQLAQKLRSGGPAIPVVSEVEAKIAYHIDDLESARHLLTELITVDPHHPEHYILAAQIDLRLGNQNQARETLIPVLEQFYDEPVVLIGFAQLLATAGHPMGQVLELAYRARRLGISDARVQSAYLDLFLLVEKDAGFLDPTHVDVDTAVQIEADRQLSWYVLLDVDQPDRSRGEILPNDPLAQKLIGLRQGDTTIVVEHPVRTITGTIVDIQSKFVRAFQETISNFNMNFPDELGLIRIPFPIGDPDQIVALPNIGAGRMEKVLDAYLDRRVHMPLGSVARLGGRNLVESWQHLTNAPQGRLWAATGHLQEQRKQAELLSSANEIVLELTALLTLWRLDLVSIIGQRYEHWYIARSLLDELSKLIDKLKRFGSGGAQYMGVHEGMLRLTEVSPEVLQAEIAALAKLRLEVEAKGTTVPISSALAIGRAKYEQLESTIGRQQLDSMLIAKEVVAPLYSDDLWLRVLARDAFAVEGAWSQALLDELVKRELLSVEDYFSSLRVLISSNYYYISVNVDFFLHTLNENGWSVTSEVQEAFLVLGGPDTTPQSAVGIVVKLIKETWFRPLLIERKLGVLDTCLLALCKNRQPALIVESFREALRAEFALAPVQLREIDQHISLWTATHRLFAN